MTEHLFREGKSRRHKENRPIDGVKADDVFTDDVDVCGPIFFVERSSLFAVESEPRDIVEQRVQPDIDDVFRVEGHRDTPLEGGTRNAQILQPRFKEVVDHFVLSGKRDDEIGVIFVVL